MVAGGSSTSSSLSMSFQRSADQKLGEKLSDIAVVSLVPSAGSSHQSSSSTGTVTASSGAREDYDSSATVRQSS